MNFSSIQQKILEVYQTCGIHSFPFDCQDIVRRFDYSIYTYHELKNRSPEIYEICMSYSRDAFTDPALRLIAYNSSNSTKRTRFSLMHELGHIVLEHSRSSPETEKEANFFAGHILAPRMAVYYAACKNVADVSRIFDISLESAGYAYDDFLRWRRNVQNRRNKMTVLEKQLYEHFYSQEHGKFVYTIKICPECGAEYVNSTEKRCPDCQESYWFRRTHYYDCEDPRYMVKEWWQ